MLSLLAFVFDVKVLDRLLGCECFGNYGGGGVVNGWWRWRGSAAKDKRGGPAGIGRNCIHCPDLPVGLAGRQRIAGGEMAG